jgi:spore coat protein A, manganese oxidase
VSFRGCRDGETSTTLPEAAPPGDGGMCTATVASAAAEPVRPPLHPESLARFVDPLPIPPVLAQSGRRPDPARPDETIAYYRVAMRTTEVRVHRDVPPTRMWGYEGSVPGPTIDVRKGRGVLVEWSNELPKDHFLPIDHTLHGAHADQPDVRTAVHVHGAKVAPESDGYPEDWYPSGRSTTSHYPLQQDAATLWYHDHAMGIERLNQYAGLFGAFLVRDDAEDSLGLPRGDKEIPLILCDRLFGADGQLIYPTSGMAAAPWVSEVNGDATLINGKLFPFVDVEPRRYRLRIVNASNSRFYYLSFVDGSAVAPFHQIGSDQGLLPVPVPLTSVTLAPAERADIVVDFGPLDGQHVVLRSQALELMQLRVAAAPRRHEAPLPAALRRVARIPEAAAAKSRTLTLNDYRDTTRQRMIMLLNKSYWRDEVTEKPELDSVEIWSLMNLTEDTHPIHLHLVRFQVLDRQKFDADEFKTSGHLEKLGAPVSPEPNEMGWKDTVRAYPGFITRIIMRFEGYAGRYVWHCHVLEHAANEMMRPFDVVARQTP